MAPSYSFCLLYPSHIRCWHRNAGDGTSRLASDSRGRWNPDAGRVDKSTLEKGPNGFSLCRFCNEETPSARHTFCSDGCVHEHKVGPVVAMYACGGDVSRTETVCRACLPCRANIAYVVRGTKQAILLPLFVVLSVLLRHGSTPTADAADTSSSIYSVLLLTRVSILLFE